MRAHVSSHAHFWTEWRDPGLDAGGGAAPGRWPFTLSEANAPQPQSGAVALRTLGGIDALIALQGIEDPAERRRRAVKHGTPRA